jgi:TonB family protein
MGVVALVFGFFLTDTRADTLSEDLLKGSRLPGLQGTFKTPHKDRVRRVNLPKDAVAPKPDPLTTRGADPAPTADAKRARDQKLVKAAGLLGFLDGPEGSTSNVFSSGGLGIGLNEALGQLRSSGPTLADSGGLGGLGSRGVGPVTGGPGLGIGGVGTRFGGRGGPGNNPFAVGLGDGQRHQALPPPATPLVVGGCEKSTIARVISRHAGQISYCYEGRLSADPNLSGKVTVSFTIDPTGAVSDADISQSTLGDAALEQCMLARVRTWKFPEPKGGVCVIHYPWVFQLAGSDGE